MIKLDSISNIKKQFNTICSAIISDRFDIDTKVLLFDYYDYLVELLEKKYNHEIITSVDCFDEDYYKSLICRSDKYYKKFVNNFIKNKEFHNYYLSEILDGIEDYNDFVGSNLNLSKTDFLELVSMFMKSINQEALFNKLYNTGSLCFDDYIADDTLGFTLFNSLNNKFELHIRDNNYNIDDLVTMCHEFGHCFEFDNFHNCNKDYAKYSYLSIYGEVISKLFERLLLRFLLKENIYVNESRAKFLEFEMDNRDFLIKALYISTLSDERLSYIFNLSDDYNLSDEFLYLKNDCDDYNILKGLDHVNIKDSYSYAYGDIISMFLCEEIEKNGFSIDIFNDFMKNRFNLFDEKYFLELGYSPNEYIKLHKNELKLLKK